MAPTSTSTSTAAGRRHRSANPISALRSRRSTAQPAANHDPALTKLLLDAGADPNDGKSLYHSLENPACTRLLLEYGARIAESNAIYRAIDLEDDTALKLLLAHGGDPNEPARNPPLTDWGSPLAWAIYRRRPASREGPAGCGRRPVARHARRHQPVPAGAAVRAYRSCRAAAGADRCAGDFRRRTLSSPHARAVTKPGRERGVADGPTCRPRYRRRNCDCCRTWRRQARMMS